MALPTPDQAIPRAIVRERIPAVPAAGSPAELARRINEQNDQGNWRGAFERSKMPQVERGKIEQVREQIKGEFDPATGNRVRNAEQQARYNRLGIAQALDIKYLEQGYDGLTPAEQGDLINKILAEANLKPAIRNELLGLPLARQQEFARRLLKDPKMAAKAREFLTQITSRELADAVTPAQEQLTRATSERDNKQADLDDVTRRITAIDRQLTEFARPAVGVGAIGSKAREIDRIKNNLTTIQTGLATYRAQISGYESKLGQLGQERGATLRAIANGHPVGGVGQPRDLPAIDGEVATETGNLRTAETERDKRQADIEKLPSLEQEQQQLEQRKQEIERERREKQSALDQATIEFNKRRMELQDARGLRASHEEDLVQGFENVFAQATNDMIMDQVDAAAQKFDSEIERLKQETVDQQEKAMYDAIEERWLGPEQIRRRGLIGFRTEERYRPIDRSRVNADFATLMTQGPERLMRDLLTGRINPATSANYTVAEIDALIANRDFVNKIQPEAVKQLLGRRILTGGLNQYDIHHVVNSQWGQGLIAQALAKNTEFRQAVEGVMGAGALSRHGFVERLGQEIRRHPWWLALLLGIPFLVGGAIRTTATQESIST